MKKVLVLLGLMAGITGTFAYENYTYAPEYISHLKNCSPYTDEYTVDVPTADANSPYLKLKSKEEITGWLNGKCMTKSTVFSLDLNEKIMVIKCGLSKEQLKSLMDKMKAVNSDSGIEARQVLSDEMVKIIEDGSTCKVKNYLNE